MTQRFEIAAHRLVGARYRQARSYGRNSRITPTLIVMHETAGRLTKYSSVNWFTNARARTSAHIVIERDGTVTQMVPFNRKAYHAGVSVWKGRQFANSFSIGVELVGPGKLDDTGQAWFGQTFEGAVARSTPEHGNGHWLEFTHEQIEAAKHVCQAIMAEYPDCNEIAGHYQVSPGRKVDPAPTLDLQDFAAAVLEPDKSADDVSDFPEHESTPPPPPTCEPDTGARLAASSRKYRTTGAAKGLLGGGVVVGAAAEGLSLANIQATKTYLDTAAGFVGDYGFSLFVAACVGGFVLFEFLQKWMRDDVESGRAIPSGEVEND
jgi:N-acetylmuramoyl-L-alanine amidase